MAVSLYRKMRPVVLSDVVGQDMAKRSLANQFRGGKVFPVSLFYGPRGTGKTTLGQIVALGVNCLNIKENGDPCCECDNCRAILSGGCGDVTMIDAGSNTGADNIRALKEQASYLPLMLKYKVYIIDEVHQLSGAAFSALLELFENVPEHCKFVLCTTDYDKLPEAIISRARRYPLGRIPNPEMKRRLMYVARKEGIDIDEEAIRVIARHSDGALRNALVALEDAGYSGKKVTASDIAESLGAVEELSVVAFVQKIFDFDLNAAMKMVASFAAEGKNFTQLIKAIAEVLSDIMLYRAGAEVVASDDYLSALDSFSVKRDSQLCDLSALVLDSIDSVKRDCSVANFSLQIARTIKELKDSDGITIVASAVEEKSAPVVRKEPEEIQRKAEEIVSEAEKLPCDDVGFDGWGIGDDFPDETDNDEGSELDKFDIFGNETGQMDAETVASNTDGFVDEIEGKNNPFDRMENGGDKPDEGPEEEDFPFPEFLRTDKLITLSDTAREAAMALREVCRKEKAFNLNMSNGIKAEPWENGIRLYAADSTTLSATAIMAARYGIPNVTLQMA